MFYYSYRNLKRVLRNPKTEKYVRVLENYYKEYYENQPILALNYSYAKLYFEDGNRVKFQNMYFDRRKRLMILQILAILDDKFIQPLEEIMATICDEFTWVLPAHNTLPDDTFNYTFIDLFSAETGMYLAETVFVLTNKLSGDIKKRVNLAIHRQILSNYESRSFWWETAPTNWSAVCSCAIGLTYLYLFPVEFEKVKNRIMNAFKYYFTGLGEDGYCTEGYSYWAYGFGYYSIFCDVYQQLTGEKLDFIDKNLIQNTIEYGKACILDKDVYLPFADGGSKGEHDEAPVLCVIERLFNENLYINISDLYKPSAQALGYRVLVWLDKKEPVAKDFTKTGTKYYKNSQVFIRQNGNYVFVAKGGHNAEIHNHNDIGAFSIIKNNRQLIADLGVGEYTKDYFDNQEVRHGEKIFVCSSYAHSVPIIDGKVQGFGCEYSSKMLKQDDECFVLDISGAYGENDKTAIVAYRVEKNSIKIKYTIKDVKEKIVFRFVSFIPPKIIVDKVNIEDLSIHNDIKATPFIKAKEYSGYLGKKHNAYLIDYTVEKVGDVNAHFVFDFQE